MSRRSWKCTRFQICTNPNMVELYLKSLCSSVFKMKKALCHSCVYLLMQHTWGDVITLPLLSLTQCTVTARTNYITSFCITVRRFSALSPRPQPQPLIKVHLFIEVSKAKAAFLKTALGCGESEPARLRATVNNADTLSIPLLHCHIQNDGGEWCGLKDTEGEDKHGGGLKRRTREFFVSPLLVGEDKVTENEREVQAERNKGLRQGYRGS